MIDLINRYWKFDDDQQHVSTWRDKQNFISAIEQLSIQGVMPSVYVITYNDYYGRPIFDNCFNNLKIAKEYVNDHDYLKMDNTTVIKEIDFE